LEHLATTKAPDQNLSEACDVVIIGAGVVGNFVAYELSKYELKIKIVEKCADVGFGMSKGHDGILHVLQLPFGSLKSKLCLEGNKMYDKVALELSVPLKRTSTIILSTSALQVLLVPFLRFYLAHNLKGFNVRTISSKELSRAEPNLRRPRRSLVVDGYGLIDPFELHWRLRESNELNGVEYQFDTAVKEITLLEDDSVCIECVSGETPQNYVAKFVINASGASAQDIASTLGDKYFVKFDKGVSVVYSEAVSNHIIAPLALRQSSETKGGGALLTYDGKSIWGPNLVPISSSEDLSVSEKDVSEIEEKFGRLFKSMPKIRLNAYSGIRAIEESNDFIIAFSKRSTKVVHCVGVSSPGYTAAPAIAKLVAEMISQEKSNLRSKNRGIPESYIRTEERLTEVKGEDLGQWGNILSPETGVSEAEVRQAVRRGARTLDAIIQRTKFTYEKAQGGDSLFRVIEVMADELRIDPSEVSKQGGISSWLLIRKE
jgi:glycerol-3-phosphate dehydrogenase